MGLVTISNESIEHYEEDDRNKNEGETHRGTEKGEITDKYLTQVTEKSEHCHFTKMLDSANIQKNVRRRQRLKIKIEKSDSLKELEVSAEELAIAFGKAKREQGLE